MSAAITLGKGGKKTFQCFKRIIGRGNVRHVGSKGGIAPCTDSRLTRGTTATALRNRCRIELQSLVCIHRPHTNQFRRGKNPFTHFVQPEKGHHLPGFQVYHKRIGENRFQISRDLYAQLVVNRIDYKQEPAAVTALLSHFAILECLPCICVYVTKAVNCNNPVIYIKALQKHLMIFPDIVLFLIGKQLRTIIDKFKLRPEIPGQGNTRKIRFAIERIGQTEKGYQQCGNQP